MNPALLVTDCMFERCTCGENAGLASWHRDDVAANAATLLRAGMRALCLDRVSVPRAFGVAGQRTSRPVAYDGVDVRHDEIAGLQLWLYDGEVPVIERPLAEEHPEFAALLAEHAPLVATAMRSEREEAARRFDGLRGERLRAAILAAR